MLSRIKVSYHLHFLNSPVTFCIYLKRNKTENDMMPCVPYLAAELNCQSKYDCVQNVYIKNCYNIVSEWG